MPRGERKKHKCPECGTEFLNGLDKDVEAFIGKGTTFGDGGRDRDKEFRDGVKKVILRFIERLIEWGYEVPDPKWYLNKQFGLVSNLCRYGVPKIPKGVKNFKGNYTDPKKALELVNAMSKANNPVGELIDTFKKQPKYLRH